jgi:hypothetical protein
MFRRRRKSFLAVLPLVLTIVAVLGPARAADARPLGGELAQLAWRWLAAALSLETLNCDHGPATDPNGRCAPVYAQETLSCDLGPMIDPNGLCGQNPASPPG